MHLEDLMLRRTRLGLLLADGGATYLPRIRQICQHELGWDDATWDAEEVAYLSLWRAHYSLPPRELIPDWTTMMTKPPSHADMPVGRSEKRGKTPVWVWGLIGGAGNVAHLEEI